MRSTLPTIVALAAGVQLASADWTGASPFSCPANTNNYCNSQQSSGWDWSTLGLGSFSSYSDFNFEGWSCDSSFSGGLKRDLLTERGSFQDKCITGTASSDVSSCPSFGCGSSSSVSEFSITEIQITVEFDCSLEFHYTMPGGSTCKQTSSCSAGGTTVKNSQCGGAKNVTVVYPSQPAGSSGEGKSSCSIGVHSVGFDCSTASSTVYHSTTSKSTPTKGTTSAEVTTSAQVTTTSTPAVTTSTPKETKTISSSAEQVTSSAIVYSNSTTSSILQEVTSSSVAALSVYTSPSVSEVITTVIVTTSTTVCPVTLTQGSSTIVSASTSTVLITTTKTICTKCEAESSTTAIATTTSSSAPVTTASCPDVLPQCLNTWLFSVGCSSNTDTACFCPSEIFITNIFECVNAYGTTTDIISQAQIYLQGICSPYIGTNPALVTGASSVATSGVAQTSYAVTTVLVYTTLVVPCTDSAGSTIPSSSSTTILSTSLVVPQVVFATTTGVSTTEAVLVTGQPTSVNAGVVATQTTFAVSTSSNATVKASTPTQQTTSAAGKNTIALGSLFAAVLFASLIL